LTPRCEVIMPAFTCLEQLGEVNRPGRSPARFETIVGW